MPRLTCKQCNIEKEASGFPVASITKSGRAGTCKECYSVRNRNKRVKRAKTLHEMFDKSCRDCGISHDNPSFFDFHHIDKSTKHREVKQILNGSWDKIMTEVDKCVMLCPNCHRERHLKEGW